MLITKNGVVFVVKHLNGITRACAYVIPGRERAKGGQCRTSRTAGQPPDPRLNACRTANQLMKILNSENIRQHNHGKKDNDEFRRSDICGLTLNRITLSAFSKWNQ